MPSAEGWPGAVAAEAPSTASPQERVYLFKHVARPSRGAGPVFLALSFQPQSSAGWVCTDPLPLLSVGRKCEKTAPRSVP